MYVFKKYLNQLIVISETDKINDFADWIWEI